VTNRRVDVTITGMLSMQEEEEETLVLRLDIDIGVDEIELA
jgi:hypothetical protein